MGIFMSASGQFFMSADTAVKDLGCGDFDMPPGGIGPGERASGCKGGTLVPRAWF
jgi:hypothetical protein